MKLLKELFKAAQGVCEWSFSKIREIISPVTTKLISLWIFYVVLVEIVKGQGSWGK